MPRFTIFSILSLRALLAFAAVLGTLCALSLRARGADPPDSAPPAGLTPAKVTLAEVLHRHRTAVGSLGSGIAPTRVEHWKISYGSLTGTLDEWRSGADYRVEETLGPDRSSHGSVGGRVWSMNSNGQIAFGRRLHRRDDVNALALDSASPTGITLLGQIDRPISAYVVRVDPPGGRLQYLFFDKTTFLIARIEEIRDGRRITVTFSDFRTTKGTTEAWKIHSSDGFSTNDDDSELQSLTLGGAVSSSDLAIPASAPAIVQLNGPTVKVPAEIADDRIVIPVHMGDHTVDFIMDSGADGIVIDQSVVRALGIKEYGRITNEMAGTYVESSVVLPKMTLGSLTMENVHASSLPFVQWSNSGKPIAGLLGFDFIHDVVWHVDYVNGTLEALDPRTFAPPPGAHAFPVTFDDRIPSMRASIAGVDAPALVVDTGADRSALFSPFMQAHAQISDRGLGEAMQAAYPFVDAFHGVGGTVDFRPLQAGPFVLHPWTFPKWLFYVTQDAPTFEVEDYDGLIGQDVLRNFDLYLDYPHERIYLVPNQRFRQRWSQ